MGAYVGGGGGMGIPVEGGALLGITCGREGYEAGGGRGFKRVYLAGIIHIQR